MCIMVYNIYNLYIIYIYKTTIFLKQKDMRKVKEMNKCGYAKMQKTRSHAHAPGKGFD